jgi:hypothetical protein
MYDFTLFVFSNIDYLCTQELFDNIAPQNAEIRTVPKSLPLIFKNSAKCLSIRQLVQTG